MDLEALKSPVFWIALGLLALLWGLGTLFERTHQENVRRELAEKQGAEEHSCECSSGERPEMREKD